VDRADRIATGSTRQSLVATSTPSKHAPPRVLEHPTDPRSKNSDTSDVQLRSNGEQIVLAALDDAIAKLAAARFGELVDDA